VSAGGLRAPWPPASPHPPETWGPEPKLDPRHSLAVADQSRAVTSLNPLYYFPQHPLSSQPVSQCRGRCFISHQSKPIQPWYLILMPMEEAAFFWKWELKIEFYWFITILLPGGKHSVLFRVRWWAVLGGLLKS